MASFAGNKLAKVGVNNEEEREKEEEKAAGRRVQIDKSLEETAHSKSTNCFLFPLSLEHFVAPLPRLSSGNLNLNLNLGPHKVEQKVKEEKGWQTVRKSRVTQFARRNL